jgi:hypothetical protein
MPVGDAQPMEMQQLSLVPVDHKKAAAWMRKQNKKLGNLAFRFDFARAKATPVRSQDPKDSRGIDGFGFGR